MEKIRLGLVGCGAIAENQIRELLKVEEAELCAVCDLREDLAKDVAERYGIKAYYTDYAQMLAADIEGVIVCTPNFAHYENTIQAAKAGKHILVQKPFAMEISEAQEMIDAAKENKVILQAAFFERFKGCNLKMYEILSSGRLGKLLSIKAQMSHTGIDKFWLPKTQWFHTKKKSGGGPLSDLGAHHFDLIRWFSGSEVDEISAVTTNYFEEDEIEDNASVVLKMKNGVMAQTYYSFTTVGPKNFCYENIELYCEKGTLLLQNMDSKGFKLRMCGLDDEDFEEVVFEEQDGFYGMERHFAQCIRDKKTPVTTGEDGKICLEIIKKGYESAKKGVTVKMV